MLPPALGRLRFSRAAGPGPTRAREYGKITVARSPARRGNYTTQRLQRASAKFLPFFGKPRALADHAEANHRDSRRVVLESWCLVSCSCTAEPGKGPARQRHLRATSPLRSELAPVQAVLLHRCTSPPACPSTRATTLQPTRELRPAEGLT